MKTKYFLIIFILLFLGNSYCTIVRGNNYSLSISENLELTLEIKKVNEEGLENVFEILDPDEGGKSWKENIEVAFWIDKLDPNGDEVNAKLKIKIDSIKESDNYIIKDVEENEYIEVDVWKVYIDLWNYVDPEYNFNPEPDIEEELNIYFQDPEDIKKFTYRDDYDIKDSGANLNDIAASGFIIPTPVGDYLDKINWQDDCWVPIVYKDFINQGAKEDYLEWDWESDGNRIIHKATFAGKDKDSSWQYKDFKEEWIYNKYTGLITLYRILYGAKILYEVAATSIFNTIYDLSILLGVMVVLIIGLIYRVRKKCIIV